MCSREKPLVKITPPPVYFYHVRKNKIPLCKFIYLYFTLQFIFLPIQDLNLASNEFKGIDNPLAHVWCNYLLLCVYVLFMRLCVILLCILTKPVLHLLSSSGKIPTHLTSSNTLKITFDVLYSSDGWRSGASWWK